MREIQYDRRVTTLTKTVVDAIAWATNRRGHNQWKSDNVPRDILKYLKDNNVHLKVTQGKGSVREIERDNVTRAIERLVKDGYAVIKRTGGRGTITEFEFKPDVILTGHGVVFDRQEEKRRVGYRQEEKRRVGYVTPDVILTGHGVVFDRQEEKRKQIQTPIGASDTTKVIYSGDPDFPDLPIPELPAPPYQRYMAEELNVLLDEYAQLDSDAYAKWVERVIDAIRITLDLAT